MLPEVDADAAGSGREETGEHFDHGGLAGAVGAEEAEELAGLDGKIHIVNGGKFAEAAREILGGDGDSVGHAGECNRRSDK